MPGSGQLAACSGSTAQDRNGSLLSLAKKKHNPQAKAPSPELRQPPQTPGALTGRYAAWFRIAATLLIPVLVLGLAELGLRLAGYGYSTGFFKKRVIEGREVWTENPEFGKRFFPRGLERVPQVFTLPAEKSKDTIRIVVLGESAAMGDPDFKFGLPRLLEVLLRERYPEKKFEVVNTAMVAINSHVILPIARECADKQADLWVVYMGNNEMIGPFGSASVFGARAPSLSAVRAALAVKEARLGQALDAVATRLRQGKQAPGEWRGMEMMARQRVRHDAPETARVHRHFKRNLEDILQAGTQAKVPIVLCTVATNLRDCAPFASLHRKGITPAEVDTWEEAYRRGIDLVRTSKSVEAGGPANGIRMFAPLARDAFERAAAIDDHFADLAFRRARCFLDLGNDGEAAKLFRQARDLDALQFRADTKLNELIRQAAAGFQDWGVSLLDAEQLFAANSPHGVPGAEYFYEHVHLTPEGNYLLARAAAEKAAGLLRLESARPWASQEDCFRLVGLTGWNRFEALTTIIDRLQTHPFTDQIGHSERMGALNAQLDRYRPATKPAQLARETKRVAAEVARYPDDPDLRWNLALLLESCGDIAGAAEQWKAVIRLQPQSALPAFNLARLLDRPDNETEAMRLYRDCLKADPGYFAAHYALGSLCLKTGSRADAVRHLRAAVKLKPGSAEARTALATAMTE